MRCAIYYATVLNCTFSSDRTQMYERGYRDMTKGKQTHKTALANIALSLGKVFLVCLNEAAEFTDQMFSAHPACRALCRPHKRDSVRVALRRLQDQGFIIKKSSLPGTFVLTSQGKHYVAKLIKRFSFLGNLKNIEIEASGWDGKWRLLVFDIPEKRRRERKLLRYELSVSGFRRMQKSVWISPYRINESFVDRLNSIGKLGGAIEFIVAESISNEKKYKKLFTLVDGEK